MPRSEIPTARQIFNTCARLSGVKKRNDPVNKVCSILLTSALVGVNDKRISDHISMSLEDIELYSKEIRAKKIWTKGKVNAVWKDDKWGSMPLLHDTMSVLGLRERHQ